MRMRDLRDCLLLGAVHRPGGEKSVRIEKSFREDRVVSPTETVSNMGLFESNFVSSSK